MPDYMGPSFDTMMPELIQALKNLEGSGSIAEINRETIRLLNLPQNVTDFPHNRGNKTEIEYRLAWTRTFLRKAGYLENTARGIWVLTEKGKPQEALTRERL